MTEDYTHSLSENRRCVIPPLKRGTGTVIGNLALAQVEAEHSFRPGLSTTPTIEAVKSIPANSEITESIYYLPQVWAEFLSRFKWDWFVTIVPDHIVHPESLDKLRDVFIHHLNQHIYGRNYWKDKTKGVFWAFGMERQRRGAPHVHGLIGGLPDFMSRNIEYNWLREHGAQFSKIESYRPASGAEYYMSKSAYAWKHGEIDTSDTLALEQDGKRVCGKVLHHNYCEQFAKQTPLLRHHLASFQFS